MAKCPDCDSTSDLLGLIGDGKCSQCHGAREQLLSGLNKTIFGTPLECYKCSGSGACQTCGGTGEVDRPSYEPSEYSSKDATADDEDEGSPSANYGTDAGGEQDRETDSDDYDDVVDSDEFRQKSLSSEGVGGESSSSFQSAQHVADRKIKDLLDFASHQLSRDDPKPVGQIRRRTEHSTDDDAEAAAKALAGVAVLSLIAYGGYKLHKATKRSATPPATVQRPRMSCLVLFVLLAIVFATLIVISVSLR
jgi:hypothetical protein